MRMKKISKELKSRCELAEERISQLEDRQIESILFEQQREKKEKNEDQ